MVKSDDCFACGAAVPDDAMTCPACGYPVGVAFDSQPSFDRGPEPVGRRSGMRAAAVVLLATAIAGGMFLVLNRDNDVEVADTATQSTTSLSEPSSSAPPSRGSTPATTAPAPPSTTSEGSTSTLAPAEPLPSLDREAAEAWLDKVVVVEAVGCGTGAITSGVIVGDRLVMTAGEIAAHPWVLRVYGADGELLAANDGAGDDLINGRTAVGAMTLLSIDAEVPVPDIPGTGSSGQQPVLRDGDELLIVGWPGLDSLDQPAQLVDAVVARVGDDQTELAVDGPLGRSIIGSPVVGGDGQLVGLVKSIAGSGVRLTFPWSDGLQSATATCSAARPWIPAEQADVFRDPAQQATLRAQAAADAAAAFTGFGGLLRLVPLACVDCEGEVAVWRYGRHTFGDRVDSVIRDGAEVPLDAELFSDAVQSVNRLGCITWAVDAELGVSARDEEEQPGDLAGRPLDERARWIRADEIRPDTALETMTLVDAFTDLCLD
ncbi:MAG: hypothetical protein HKN26_03615 [Acidimicrobiales bacterium]|nr:hypothetical protein [Acidimicrobiales bacterium]